MIKKIVFLSTVAVAICLSGCSNKNEEIQNTKAQESYIKAQKLFNENKRIEAIELFKQSSELGNLDARYSLASEYLIGKFIKEDEEAGIRLLKEAALSGHQASKNLLKELNIDTQPQEATPNINEASKNLSNNIQGEKNEN